MTDDIVVLTVDYDDADDLANELAQNVANNSICVGNDRALPVGTDVRLALACPGLIEPVRIDGVVRWVQSGAEPMLGIEFLRPPRDELAQTIARIRDRDPRLIKRLLRVLVVEDNHHVAELICHGLGSRSRHGGIAFECRTACDGREALAQVKTKPYDVMIVDIYLPVVGGAQLISLVRHELAMSALPIIAVSAGGAAAEQDAMAAGANIFIDKPMRLSNLVDTMRTLLNLGAA